MYKTLFTVAYYGLMQIGELTLSQHVLKAKNVHMAKNKDKLMLVLYSSKTHNKGSKPQKIKLTANHIEKSGQYRKRHVCPFKLTREFILVRGDYVSDEEQFFIFRDRSPVTAYHARTILKTVLNNIGLDSNNYGMHSFRIGRTIDLIKFGYSVDEVKMLGRWRSNVIYKYIKP